MPPRYNPMNDESALALLSPPPDSGAGPIHQGPRPYGDTSAYLNDEVGMGMISPENVPDESPIHLIGNPGSAPGMPSPKGVRPDVPRGQQAVPGMPTPGRQATPQGGGFSTIDDNYVEAYKEVLRQKFPGMDEQKLNQYADYGIAKQRGKMAAQNKKLLAKPIGQYFGALQQESTARNNVEALRESMKAKQAEFMRPDGSMAPEWMPYQDKIDSAIMRAQQAGTRRKQMQEHLGKYGVKPESLENQITLMEFMRQLAGGDPSTASEIEDDDPLETFGDGQTEDFNPSAGLLR